MLLVNLKEFKQRVTVGLSRLRRRIVTMSGRSAQISTMLPFMAGTRVKSTADRSFLDSLNIKGFSIYVITVKSSFRGSLRMASLLGRLNTEVIISHTSHSIRTGFLLEGNTSRVICPRERLTS